ncbi:MAG: hypothetical protein DDT40_01456 [candidate division WS2 bacterium]|nr:hypothetical protein [Candidatus Psychracetigena formicireducens]
MKHKHDSPEARAYMVADNKLTDDSTWDNGKLRTAFRDLKLEGFDVELTGFENVELEGFDVELNSFGEIVEDDNFDPETKVESKCKKGDIYKLGNHRLMCGDACNENDVTILLDNNIIDLFFSDPPYGVSYADKNAFLNAISRGNRIQTPINNDHKSIEDMKEIWLSSFTNAFNASKKGACYYICSPQGGELMMMMMMILQAGWELKHTIIWVKNNHVLGRADYNYKHEPLIYGWKDTGHKYYGSHGDTSVWEINKPHKSDLHPTMKPIELCAKVIQNSSLQKENVLDLFGGSGSTLIACEQLHRTCYMMEIDPHYCDIIIVRWEDFTGERAKKMN